MTYNVFGGTLNIAQLNNVSPVIIASVAESCDDRIVGICVVWWCDVCFVHWHIFLCHVSLSLPRTLCYALICLLVCLSLGEGFLRSCWGIFNEILEGVVFRARNNCWRFCGDLDKKCWTGLVARSRMVGLVGYDIITQPWWRFTL